MTEPFFRPFEGIDYRAPKIFPGRLLVVGESYYLTEADKRSLFTQDMIDGLIKSGPGAYSNTDYYRNVFSLLRDKPAGVATMEEWAEVWNSLAFYSFVQTAELKKARERPKREHWKEAQERLPAVLQHLKPELILITGIQACGYATSTKVPRPESDRPGVWLPTGDGRFAYTRCIYHPSYRYFAAKRQECLAIVKELLDRTCARPL